jgi:hypothetical protein
MKTKIKLDKYQNSTMILKIKRIFRISKIKRMILKSTQKKVKEINNKLIVIKKIFNKKQKNIKMMIRI